MFYRSFICDPLGPHMCADIWSCEKIRPYSWLDVYFHCLTLFRPRSTPMTLLSFIEHSNGVPWDPICVQEPIKPHKASSTTQTRFMGWCMTANVIANASDWFGDSDRWLIWPLMTSFRVSHSSHSLHHDKVFRGFSIFLGWFLELTYDCQWWCEWVWRRCYHEWVDNRAAFMDVLSKVGFLILHIVELMHNLEHQCYSKWEKS